MRLAKALGPEPWATEKNWDFGRLDTENPQFLHLPWQETDVPFREVGHDTSSKGARVVLFKLKKINPGQDCPVNKLENANSGLILA